MDGKLTDQIISDTLDQLSEGTFEEQRQAHMEEMGCDGECEDCDLHGEEANNVKELLTETHKAVGEVLSIAMGRLSPTSFQLLVLSLGVKFTHMSHFPSMPIDKDMEMAAYILLKLTSNMADKDILSSINAVLSVKEAHE